MSLKLEIVTPERSFFNDEVDMVIVRGLEGDLAIMKDRSPLITPLKIGKVRIMKDGEERVAAVVDGYVTVSDNKATVITDSAEWPDEIDVERAEEARKRAEKRLEEKSDAIDTARAEAALKRSINRLEVSKLLKK